MFLPSVVSRDELVENADYLKTWVGEADYHRSLSRYAPPAFIQVRATGLTVIVILILSASAILAGPDNEYIDRLHILPKLIEAAEASEVDSLHTQVLHNKYGEPRHWFLSTAHFVGQFDAPFGRVYVAQFVFTESRERDSKFHSRHNGFICFFDAKYRLRQHWRFDQPSPLLYGSRSTIMMEDHLVLDFNDPAPSGKVHFDGRLEEAPKW